jgi:hypothetical protein
MQTLGLASAPQPTDGLFKRLFWPTIENLYDVDLVGQQGFWVCTVVAVLSTIMLVVSGNVILGVLIGITYFLAGLGVRERSLVAAVVISLCYALDRIAGFEMGQAGNPLFPSVAMMLLFANVRATFLTRRWTASANEDVGELPDRTMDSFTDKLANGFPAKAWPKLRWLFYPLGFGLLALSILSVIVAAKQRPRPTVKDTPSATYEVSPPQ